ncbi:hypothetical protein COV20_01215 [Candidatus Woesearchaeota archaeon CG10_big_fil_rev_8_21_14_0_10_45_16]|nr:MAG: hypothetical protein COV20_01215 [Candidatus Woesearchaeota archaeon CG10_big_fil_rev_8_21_14_0_10_45_16]
MHPFWKKVEKINSKLIPYALLLLLGIIFYELAHIFKWTHYENHTLETAITVLDGFIISIFIIDLIFLAIDAKTIKEFFKRYWLDIVAVFPFVLLFTILSRLYSFIFRAGEIAVGQAILHESLEASKGAKEIAKSGRLARVLRIAARSLRFVSKGKNIEKRKTGLKIKNPNKRDHQKKKKNKKRISKR